MSTFCGKVSSWLFVAIGCIIFYEVISRYVFNQPTIWVEEMSRFLQIWASYLAAAYVLQHKHLIAINVVEKIMPAWINRLFRCLSLTIIGLFSLVAVWKGSLVVVDSIRIGRASSTMLEVPLWLTEIAIPIGFTLLFFQVLLEFAEVLTGKTVSSRLQEGPQ